MQYIKTSLKVLKQAVQIKFEMFSTFSIFDCHFQWQKILFISPNIRGVERLQALPATKKMAVTHYQWVLTFCDVIYIELSRAWRPWWHRKVHTVLILLRLVANLKTAEMY